MNPLTLIILDGWGVSHQVADNAIALAKTPFFDSLLEKYPHTQIEASGPAVGLPEGIMGNSEVGHMNIGSGRIVFTGLSQIYKAIEDGSFFKNENLLKAMSASKKSNTSLHLMGLLSDGAVHSHQDHLYALIEMAKKQGLGKVFIHCFMDGRDTSPKDGIKYIQQLEKVLIEKNIGKIASVSGRYYAMDRDKRWDRVEKAFDVLTGENFKGEKTASQIVEKAYQENVSDEFIIPQVVLKNDDQPVATLNDGDSVIFFNFRADRARQITYALTEKNFDGFKRKKQPQLSSYICMAPYDEKLNLPVAFKPNLPTQVLAQILSENSLKQLKIAETEKYAHVTFFFNGGVEKVFKGEDRILIPSNREVPTYDHKPEMSAVEITSEVIKKIKDYDVIIMNYANTDMVGHTAIKKAVIKSVEVVDTCLKQVVEKVLENNGIAIITADHGNAEQMVDAKGNPHTAHSTNPVPFILISKNEKSFHLNQNGGRLCDIAPTMLQILNIKQPDVMTGKSLIL